jgi:hypothetical protein
MSTTLRTATGDLALPRVIVTDLASVTVQTIKDGLSLWLAEWFLDQNVGFPWLQKILGIKNPNPAKLGKYIRQFLLSVPGVFRVSSTAAYTAATRAFSYQFVANLDNGQIITRNADGSYDITGSP